MNNQLSFAEHGKFRAIAKDLFDECDPAKLNPTERDRLATVLTLRIGYLDSAFEVMDIAMHKILRFFEGPTPADSHTDFRYHMEAFIFAYVGVYDRALALAAAILLGPDCRLDGPNRRTKAYDKISSSYPLVKTALDDVGSVIDDLKAMRNSIAHESGFSSRDYELALYFRTRAQGMDEMEILDLLRGFYRDEASDLARRYGAVRRSMDALAEALTDPLIKVTSQATS